jgi:hypothetical protein
MIAESAGRIPSENTHLENWNEPKYAHSNEEVEGLGEADSLKPLKEFLFAARQPVGISRNHPHALQNSNQKPLRSANPRARPALHLGIEDQSPHSQLVIPRQKKLITPQGLLHPSQAHRRHSDVQMPSGLYAVPEVSEEEWIQHQQKFFPERILHLYKEVDDFTINQLIALMLFADAEDQESPQYLYLNSQGGSVIAGLALYDTMQHVSSPVITLNLGMAASTASLILGAGVRGKRVAMPGSMTMIHQPSSGGTRCGGSRQTGGGRPGPEDQRYNHIHVC